MSDDGGRWESVGVPVAGFEVGAGKMVGIDDDGAVHAPIVALTLTDTAGSQHRYTLHPFGAKSMSDALGTAATVSVTEFEPEAVKAAEKSRRAERRSHVLLLSLALVIIASFSALTGFAESHRYTHHGGVAAGIAGGVDQFVLLCGWLSVWFFLAMQASKRIRQRRERKAKKSPPLSPDPPAQESIP